MFALFGRVSALLEPERADIMTFITTSSANCRRDGSKLYQGRWSTFKVVVQNNKLAHFLGSSGCSLKAGEVYATMDGLSIVGPTAMCFE